MTDERFIPGQVLAGRYRIVERVGRGGMGEVYRAEDLKLGHPVALKFLPLELSREPRRLEEFFAEVRLARQISHPHVCRVYDIQEIDGMHFLSMEFVDGEDLASLLRRIGRLPAAKATEIAREMCAGLAAIHDRGVLHRDLKPANVMIDGRGHARITDFGLAETQGAVTDSDTIAGTPAYLAPECLFEGRAASVRSDLYSLGLVLYELFTGRPAFDAPTPREALRIRRESTPVSPSHVQSDVDPRVERVILRCLEKDPERRPPAALSVAAALPGGDPLSAAIAAGKTPSPELVAAPTTGAQGLRPAAAWSLFAAVLVGLLLVTMLSPRTRLVPALPMLEPPEAMAGRAKAMLEEFGFPQIAADRAYGYRFKEFLVERIVIDDRSSSRWRALSRVRPPVATFWYRESPGDLMPANRWQRVTYFDPPWGVEGMAGVELDALGRLRQLRVSPTWAMSKADAGALDVNALFRAAGLDTADFRTIPPGPIGPGDLRMAYESRDRKTSRDSVHLVDVIALRGRVVSFDVIDWGTEPGEIAKAPRDPSRQITNALQQTVRPALFLTAMFIGIWLARRNLRAGRGDMKRALRLAGGMMALRILIWLLSGHHTRGSVTEQIMAALAWGLYDFAYAGIFYVAIEPYVRRLWPRMLTSWVRLLDGNHADPQVGRDVLIGCVAGTLIALAVAGHQAAPTLFGAPPGRPDNVGYIEHQLASLLGIRSQIGEILWLVRSNIVLIMGFLVILVSACVILRSTRAAVAATFLLFMPLGLPNGEFLALNIGLAFLSTLAVLLVMMRYGLLAAGAGLLTHTTLQSTPLGMGMDSWPASRTVLVLLLVSGVALYGFVRSLGGRPAFRDVLTE